MVSGPSPIGTQNVTVTSSLCPAGLTWANGIGILPDGYRYLLEESGGNLVIATSATGSSWLFTIVGPWSYGMNIIDSCVVDSNLFIFLANSTGANVYKFPYTNAGTFSASGASFSICSGLPSLPVAIRAIYDSTINLYETNHTAGAKGGIQLLVDTGTTWYFYLCDPHNTTAQSLIVANSTTITPNLSGSNGATNMISPSSGNVYVNSAGSSSYAAANVGFVSSQTGTQPQYIYNQALYSSNIFASTTTTDSDKGLIQTSTIPGGTCSISGTISNNYYTQAQGAWAATVYVNGYYIINSQKTQIFSSGAMGLGNVSAVSKSFYARPSMATTSIPPGSHFLVELVVVIGNTANYPGKYFVGTIDSVSYPPPALNYTTVQTYTAGSVEYPSIPYSPYGTALIPSGDGTSVDLYCHAGSSIYTQVRNASGGYSSPVPIYTNAASVVLSPCGVVATNDSIGNKAVCAVASFSSGTHIGYLERTNNVWGTFNTLDTSTGLASATVGSWIGAKPGVLGNISTAIAYLSGATSPYIVEYEDGDLNANANNKPAVLSLSAVSHANSVSWGTTSPFNITGWVANDPTTYPTFFGTYSNPTATDPLSSINYTVTDYVSSTSFASGPTPYPQSPATLSGSGFILQSVGMPSTVTQNDNGTTPDQTIVLTVQDGNTNQVSPQASVGFNLVPTPAVLVQSPSTITVANPVIVYDHYGYGQYAPLSCVVQINDSNGVVVYTSAPLPVSLPGQLSGALMSHAVIGSNTVWLNMQPPVGQVCFLGFTLGADGLTVQSVGALATSPDGYQGYPVVMTSSVTKSAPYSWAVGPRITTSPLPLFPPLNNLENYNIVVFSYCAPRSGAAWSGHNNIATNTAVPTPNAPDNGSWYGVPGSDPLEGGYAHIRFNQSSSTIPALTWNIYQRVTGETTWTLVANTPASVGIGDIKLWSLANDIEYDAMITSLGANGFESPGLIISGISIEFRLGVWMNDPNNPAICVELGYFNSNTSGTTFPLMYERIQEKDVAQLFNRAAPVLTIGTMYALHTTSNPTFTLETGYEAACLAILREWDQNGTVLQFRDMWGNMYYGTILSLKEGADTLALYQAVTLEWQMADPASHGLYIGSL